MTSQKNISIEEALDWLVNVAAADSLLSLRRLYSLPLKKFFCHLPMPHEQSVTEAKKKMSVYLAV